VIKDMEELVIGQTAALSRKYTEHDICKFAEVSGDCNPIHLDETAAKKSIFKSRVVHGVLVGSLISGVLGTVMPGPGTIYLEQMFKFLKPVYVNDICTAVVVVEEIINQEKGIYRLNTKITNQNGENVLDGYAVVKYKKSGTDN